MFVANAGALHVIEDISCFRGLYASLRAEMDWMIGNGSRSRGMLRTVGGRREVLQEVCEL